MTTITTVRLKRDYTQGLGSKACAMLRYINKHGDKLNASDYATANSDYQACLRGIVACLVLLCDALDIEEV